MKIIHIITSLDGGGAETMLYRLVIQQKNSPIKNIVVCLKGTGKYGKELIAQGIKVHALGINSLVKGINALIRILVIFSREKPDLVVSWLYHADITALLAGMIRRVPVVWNLRCAELDKKDHSKSLFVLRWLLVKLSGVPRAIIVNSVAGKRAHSQVGYHPRKWLEVPNGFDTNLLKFSEEARTTVRKELGLHDEALLIGLIARFHPMKDHITFLESAAIICKENANLNFLLVGKGADNQNSGLVQKIEALGLKKYVHMLGEQSEVERYIASLDILVSSSYSEGFPNVVGEAMACAVPCVVTDAGDSKLLVADTGFVVPCKNPRALAEAMLNMVNMDQGERMKMGQAARTRIVENYSIPVISDKYQHAYEAALATR